ncbi:hypothetical protein BST36_29120 [Mycolicibacterium moriokaense]|uniref:Uncharacterized protein n=1 Tax=Mycolicibacterium moriokaense TaxID=39691 RepID=A0AAD1M7B6_9MYCO|nr:hypothetical protein [Mycolicibacterium moriokaense]MCV7037110.1 hypothetical protein [Mycolicibacterium moriokaense]ORB13803.1 hypothetical protein BST36_29120 [Mycolicibacterium moriokaense]BBX02269.1 hypothetical protein MMOR_32050 [Mycolicibacterium moriokaense]
MNRQEREHLLAVLTDDELEQLRARGVDVGAPDDAAASSDADAQDDPARKFLRAIMAERERDWIAEVAERFSAPSQPKPRRGNHVAREGGNPGKPTPTDRQRLSDFVKTITDPTHEPTL